MPSLTRRVMNKVVSSCYLVFEAAGYHVTPNHFAYPIPDSKELTEDLFDTISDSVGIDWNEPEQNALLDGPFLEYVPEVYFEKNEGLSELDAAVLHSMIRFLKPKKIVEIGSGQSTRFAARACLMNRVDGYPCDLISVEPFPKPGFQHDITGLTRLIKERVELVDLEEISDCDLLFIDSSHVVRIGGDVNYEILELVPRLKPGAVVHWHDILLPGEYSKYWVKDRHYFWTEQYLLHAFMKFNSEFEILWASRYMHLLQPSRLRSVFPFFDPESHQISSFWIRRKG